MGGITGDSRNMSQKQCAVLETALLRIKVMCRNYTDNFTKVNTSSRQLKVDGKVSSRFAHGHKTLKEIYT